MDDQDPGLRLVHLLRGLTVEFDLLAAEFAAANRLHPTDLRALIALLDAGRDGTVATPGWLGEQLGLNSASTTGLIDRLERAGHVRRIRDTRDRRRVHVVVEERAVALGWAFFGPLITEVVTATRAFSDAELDTVRRFLGTVTGVVTRVRGPGWSAGAQG
ncbi:MarR family transcriptional regulator [Dactylosporangium sp. NPDC005572]|uniref:MarR family transcriptional regulator n=1 Tax=Dactylosporangium sp. NPDC005572 TaxID=3156889 RepID=UPI0033BC2086